MTVDAKLPLTAHLEELRWRLIKALLAIAIGFAASYTFAEQLFAFLASPLFALNTGDPTHAPVHLIGTGLVEAFFTKLKVALIAGVFAALPVILFQLWRFVAPGLYEKEKRYVVPFVTFGTLFFFSGAAFCYWMVLPVGYKFFIEQYDTIQVSPELRISEYLTFTARMLLAFGATFEMPVLAFFLARIGLLTHTMMIAYVRYAILIIFIVAAVLTPGPDVASQLLMAGPLLVLYALSILVAYLFGRTPVAPEETPPD